MFTAGNFVNYTYDHIGQLKTVTGWEADGTTPRLQEKLGYAYDAAWSLNRRTNNALIETFAVDNRKLTSGSRSGSFTVAGGTSLQRGSEWGGDYGATKWSVFTVRFDWGIRSWASGFRYSDRSVVCLG